MVAITQSFQYTRTNLKNLLNAVLGGDWGGGRGGEVDGGGGVG